jgi:uncharacterized protein YjbJ (UPF0337 family)
MGLSLCASQLGRVLWEKRPSSEDLLFSELMIWGFLHRLRTQRRLASALDTLGPMSHTQRRVADGLSTHERAKLLERLVAEIETRDPYLHGHSRRVARHSWMIARRMGLSRAEVARIRTAAAIHDVGKIETPKVILHKKGPLSDDEYEVIKRHPADGAAMATVLRDTQLTSMVCHHHERLDGTGYPSSLTGEEIPLGARIIAVADTFDAITSTRPYRAASPHKKAIDILRNEAGTQLDPAVVRAFCSHYAGRRPLALWASVASLPERVVSWLGGSIASVASTAKVITIAAIVGATAAATSTLALPVAKYHPRRALSPSTTGLRAQTVKSTPGSVFVATNSVATLRSRRTREIRHAVAGTPVQAGSPTSPSATSSSSGAGGAQPSQSGIAGGGSGQGTGPGSGGSPGNVKTEERQDKGTSEEAHDKTEEVKSKGKAEEAQSKIEEGHDKEEARGKVEETHGKVAEVVETVHSKAEEVVGKTKEVVGKTEEVVGKTKEVVVGKTEEVLGKAKEVLGKLK